MKLQTIYGYTILISLVLVLSSFKTSTSIKETLIPGDNNSIFLLTPLKNQHLDTLKISINKNGDYLVNGKNSTLKQLENALEKKANQKKTALTIATIESDIETRSYVLTQLRTILNKNGITKITYTIHPSIPLTSVHQKNDSIQLAKTFGYAMQPPIYPGCIGSNRELQVCLIESLNRHASNKFNKEVAKNIGLQPGKKIISCQIKITRTGSIEIVEIKAPHKILKAEAKRVLNLIPKIKPPIQFGELVETTQFIPIAFNID